MGKVKTIREAVDGSRLTFLRELHGMTVKDLASKLNVTSANVSQLEHNKRKIDFKTVLEVSKIFDVSHEFLLNTDSIPELDEAQFFRKKSVVTKRKQRQAVQKARLFIYLETKISLEYGLSYFELPEYANTSNEFKILDYWKIDSIANSVRYDFKLGNGPISNMTLLVERMGIRVCFIDLDDEGIDALTVRYNNHFYILINSKISSSVRVRFNIAHELGHILLHSNYSKNDIDDSSNHKAIESEAQHFAGALLMPEEGLATDMYATNMEHLKELKLHWLVSIQALIYRGNEIGLISDQQALYLRQTISRNGLRHKEPYDDEIPVEKPTFLSSALNYLSINVSNYVRNISEDTGITFSKICVFLGINNGDKISDTEYTGLHIVK
ncbi:XRE family transcriptional regulator [Lactobacillus sp. ESL0703]|uniref:XRE family transcriptional regulator n=1 Tax=Lactobacillus sp. ESL0703 TaxID=2983218 RepID=UPI0023FA2C54|nr:XRE family transcriptional regulator [Lactobacillus sp. ESL0703]MDF7668542.1 XRE family transcriptional regulator [Lactobacillus sp. ESL0703]